MLGPIVKLADPVCVPSLAVTGCAPAVADGTVKEQPPLRVPPPLELQAPLTEEPSNLAVTVELLAKLVPLTVTVLPLRPEVLLSEIDGATVKLSLAVLLAVSVAL